MGTAPQGRKRDSYYFAGPNCWLGPFDLQSTNLCNLNCVWCNAAFVRRQRRRSLSEAALLALADFLPAWGAPNSPWPPGVEAVCIAGGGEPLLNPGHGGLH